MSTPESGMCSLAEYDRGKRFIVAPDRLCTEGVYTFACKARPKLGWQACLFTVKVEEIQRAENDERPYVVTVAFEELATPNVFGNTLPYPSDNEGFITWPSGKGVFEEAYLKHRFDELDNELDNIEHIETIPFRVATVPHALLVSA